MEEAVREALLRAGDALAEVVRAGLVSRGLDADLLVRAEEARVTVVSRSRAVWAAESGETGRVPSAPMAGIAGAAGEEVVAALHAHLREALR